MKNIQILSVLLILAVPLSCSDKHKHDCRFVIDCMDVKYCIKQFPPSDSGVSYLRYAFEYHFENCSGVLNLISFRDIPNKSSGGTIHSGVWKTLPAGTVRTEEGIIAFDVNIPFDEYISIYYYLGGSFYCFDTISYELHHEKFIESFEYSAELNVPVILEH